MSEALFIVNPRRKKRRKSSRKGKMPAGLRRYWASRRKGRAAPKRRRRVHAKRRRARRANPIMNPRRSHRRRARRSNPVYSRRRHRRSNPFSLSGVKGVLVPAAIGATGAVALDVAYAYASPYLPATMQTGWFSTLAKIAGAFGIGFAASKVMGREKGKTVTLGALTVVGYGAIKPLIAGFAPSIKGLAGYADYTPYSAGGMGAYLPGIHGYMPRTNGVAGLGFTSPAAIVQPSMNASGMGELNGWSGDGM